LIQSKKNNGSIRNMIRTVTIAALAVSLALGFSARAGIIIPPTTVTFNGNPTPDYVLTITYGVTESASLYTYSYALSVSPGEQLTSFTIGGAPDPVVTDTAVISSYGGADTSLSGITGDSIIYQWDFNAGITTADVSYTSAYGPTLATFTLNGDDDTWGSPPGIPAPIPEASTILAGVLTILPLGFGAFRAWRRDRRF
jgi:hypothetical protein